MSEAMDIRSWRTLLIYGLGVSGCAAANLALARGQHVVAADDAAGVDVGDLAGRVQWLEPDAELPPEVDGVVVSPGVGADRPLIEAASSRSLPVISEVEFAYQWCDSGTFIGITGSNGKSTTTALAGKILAHAGRRVAVCGNFGTALSTAVEDGAETYVVELSSFQLERIQRFRPHVAVWLNLAADHLDRHGSVVAYAAAKEAIFRNQTGDDFAILNQDDAVVSTTQVAARRLTFSTQRPVAAGCYLEHGAVIEVDAQGNCLLFEAGDLTLAGLHNLQNAMAAGLIARSLGVERSALREAIYAFRGLPHRTELVASIHGVDYYNDSKGTNPAAAARSLAAFPDRGVHLIVGGRSKGVEWNELVSAAQGRVRRVYGIGEAGGELVKAFADVAPGKDFGDLAAALATASAKATPGEVVLLSPACASFDQYDSFAQRGDEFRRLVEAMEGSDG